MRSLLFLPLAAILCLCTDVCAVSGSRPYYPLYQKKLKIALVIGVSNYRNKDKHLSCSINDMNAMAELLKKADYFVIKVQDPDAKAMQAAIDKVSLLAVDAETLFFSFSGHGVGVQEESYMLAADVDDDSTKVPAQFFSRKQILKQFDQCHIGSIILTMDICRTSPPTLIKEQLNLYQAADEYRIKTPYLAISSSEPAGESREYGEYSLFTTFFLKYARDSALSIFDVFTNTNREVRAVSKEAQRPDAQYCLLSSFYLFKKNNTLIVNQSLPQPDTSNKSFFPERADVPVTHPLPGDNDAVLFQPLSFTLLRPSTRRYRTADPSL